jgi:hypothetical protein
MTKKNLTNKEIKYNERIGKWIIEDIFPEYLANWDKIITDFILESKQDDSMLNLIESLLLSYYWGWVKNCIVRWVPEEIRYLDWIQDFCKKLRMAHLKLTQWDSKDNTNYFDNI